ncbi:MAG: hypothetical protein ACOX3G_07735 [Armatimonadota bacterium]
MFETGNPKLRRWLPYLLFAALVLGFLWKPIFTGKALLPGDYLAQMHPWSSVVKAPDPAPQWNPLHWDAISQFYPWRVLYSQSIRSGHFPFSNPYQFSGTPFQANGQSACLYPLNFIFIIFNTITAFTIFAALHLFLAQVFMYWLMRELKAEQFGSLLAAIIFTFSAFMVLWLELPTFISVAVWLPLAFLLVHRAAAQKSLFWGMLSGATLAMSFLAGHLQIALYVSLAIGFWWIWKIAESLVSERDLRTALKIFVSMLGCIVIAGMISAPQVLPSQQLAAHSHRVREVTEFGYQSFVGNALPTYRLITAFAPWFYGDPSQNNYILLGRMPDSGHVGSAADYMEYGMYAGVLPLFLAVAALWSIKKKPIAFFTTLTILAILIATGTPLNRLLYFHVPGISALGGPNRILLLYLFGIATLAGFGADWFVGQREGIVAYFGRRIPVSQFVFCAVGLAICVFYALSSNLALQTTDKIENYSALIFAGFFSAAFVLLFLRSKATISRNLFAGLTIAIVIVDLFVFGINFNPTCERSKVYPDTPLTNELKRLTQNGEKIAPINSQWSLFTTPTHAILPPNAAIVYGLHDVQGYDSLFTKRYQQLLTDIEGVDPSPPENGNILFVRRYTPELATLAPYALSLHAIDDEKATLVKTIDGVHIYKLSGEKTNVPQYEPASFRLGLYLMLIGVGILAIVGISHRWLYKNKVQC